jgi:hypothetical protein
LGVAVAGDSFALAGAAGLAVGSGRAVAAAAFAAGRRVMLALAAFALALAFALSHAVPRIVRRRLRAAFAHSHAGCRLGRRHPGQRRQRRGEGAGQRLPSGRRANERAREGVETRWLHGREVLPCRLSARSRPPPASPRLRPAKRRRHEQHWNNPELSWNNPEQ